MNLPDLYDELWQVLDTVVGLNVPDDGPGVRSGPPSPYLYLPEVVFGSGGVGLDRIPDLEVVVTFGPANNPLVFRQALEYASTAGERSIPAALYDYAWTTCHTVFCTRAEPQIVEDRSSNPALAYVFHLDITGGK